MKLTYRGITYDYNPPRVVYGPTYAKGKYRGLPVTFQTLEVPVMKPSYNLKYRGIAYCTGIHTQAHEPKGAVTVPPKDIKIMVVPLSERSRALMAGHRQSIRKREQAMLNRLDEEVGLETDKAAHYESHIQGKIRHIAQALDQATELYGCLDLQSGRYRYSILDRRAVGIKYFGPIGAFA
ncbi:MAG: DUF4278 domain-containing protein [Thermosynechococcaceae cyanobacterium]